jgi:predicted transcriptional regulator
MAMELEVAAKKGLYEKICHENDVFIETVRDFAAKLRVLLTALERAEGDGRERPEPDKAALAAMLKAGRDFDVDKMQEILQELEQYEYERNGELVKWLSEQVTAFSYGKIEKRLAEIL